jgi:hypothetical protein
MSDEGETKRPTFDLDEMRRYVECPICYDIPRDIVLVCKNGHNVCDSCKNKLGANASCPQVT